MSISKLPGGGYRAQVYDRATGKTVSVANVLGLTSGRFPTKAAAKAAREQARALLRDQQTDTITVRAWHQRWSTDPLYQRPKESTNVTNRSATRPFVDAHADLPLASIDKRTVAQWLAGGTRNWQIQALRAMFADAASLKAGEIIATNPWAGLGISRGRGNADKAPPTIEQVDALLAEAREKVSPYFAGWLTVGCYAGMRPGELDALRWTAVDFEAGRIDVLEQYSAQSRSFTRPKNGKTRRILLPPQARDALMVLPRVSEFCFVNFKGGHYGKSGRTYPWAMVRHAVDGRSVYQSTRHFAGWFMYEHLRMPAEDVAAQLGHEDGGELVRLLYGHHDRARAVDRLERAFAQAQTTEPRIRRVA